MNTYKYYKKYYFKYICAFAIATITALYNDIYIRPKYYSYDSILRCFDHFLAALFVPGLFSILEIENVEDKGCLYILASFIYELSQVVDHGYFQYNQFFSDIIGVVVLILIHRKILSNKNCIKLNYSHNFVCIKKYNVIFMKEQRYLI